MKVCQPALAARPAGPAGWMDGEVFAARVSMKNSICLFCWNKKRPTVLFVLLPPSLIPTANVFFSLLA